MLLLALEHVAVMRRASIFLSTIALPSTATNLMSIYETDRASSLDLGEDEAITHKDAPEGEEQGIGRGEERQPDEAAGGQDQDEAPAAASTAANAKTLFGMKRSNPAVKKGVKTTYDHFPLVSHEF